MAHDQGQQQVKGQRPFKYPKARRDDKINEIHFGSQVPDPYRWLEDPDSDETKKFVEQQNAVTMPYIESCEYREKIKNRLTELWDYPKYGCPFKRGNKYFYYMNAGLQNQSVLYTMDSLDSEPKVFLDPNTLSADGLTSISTTAFSEDGKWFAYGLSDAGSDWIRIKVRDVAKCTDLDDVLHKCKYTSISWTHDNKGFFYGYYPDHGGTSDGTETAASEYQKLYYHRIGTPQADDILVVQFKDEPKWRSGGVVSDCGKYLHVFIRKGCQDCMWYYTKLDTENNPIKGELELVPVFDKFEAEFEYITNDGDITYIRTNKDAPNYRVVKVDLKKPDQSNWEDVIPENQSDVLDWCYCVNQDILVVCYIKHVVNVIELRRLNDGSFIRELKIPIGTVTSFTGKRKHSEIFYFITSFLTPGIIYHYDFNKHTEPYVFREIKLKGFDASNFSTEQIFYESNDQKIPMFIVKHNDSALDGNNPCNLYGYGGFNISIQPSFSISRILLMKHLNGIFAVANIRGGGEYGEKWHDDGKLLNKQNVFNDFINAAEFLIEKGYTSRQKLIIQGGSNGGLLVAACTNQRPDLFGCAIAHVGVMDMLRFHKFTIGHAWTTDYGNPDEEKHFNNLIKYSPLHNIPKNADKYPATLLLTADHDDRVSPLHSLKFIAELQHHLGEKLEDTPLMIRVDIKSGHGAGKPTTKIIEELSDIYSFIIKTLNLQYSE